jgi:hypothetical protein
VRLKARIGGVLKRLAIIGVLFLLAGLREIGGK